MARRVGRNIYQDDPKSKHKIRLNLFRSIKQTYYELRIGLIARRISKYASFAAGFQKQLFDAAIYEKQSYLHKIEALYSKQELRDYERRVKRGDN